MESVRFASILHSLNQCLQNQRVMRMCKLFNAECGCLHAVDQQIHCMFIKAIMGGGFDGD